MNVLEVLGALATVPGISAPLLTPGVFVSALLAYIKREPVRTAATLLAVVIVVASAVTGVPVATIIASVLGVVSTLEKVRDNVTPVVKTVAQDADPIYFHVG